MIFPGDFGVVGGVISAIVYVIGHGFIDVLNEAPFDGETAYGREETLGDAIDRVVGFGVAEGSDDVAVPQNDAVGGGALFGQIAADLTESADLIFVEVPWVGMGDRKIDGFLEFGGVEAEISGGLALPVAGGRIVSSGFWSGALGVKRLSQCGDDQGDEEGSACCEAHECQFVTFSGRY